GQRRDTAPRRGLHRRLSGLLGRCVGAGSRLLGTLSGGRCSLPSVAPSVGGNRLLPLPEPLHLRQLRRCRSIWTGTAIRARPGWADVRVMAWFTLMRSLELALRG